MTTKRQAKTAPTLEELYTLFGREAVFLVLPYGTKKFTTTAWQKINFEATQKPAYQKKLVAALAQGGNIAVRLGPLSGGLRSVDVDRKDRVDEFAELNPKLRNSVRVYGMKGCQFFFHCPAFTHGDNGAVVKLKCADGTNFGELRHGETKGAYSLVLGQHPDDAKVQWRIVSEAGLSELASVGEVVLPADVHDAKARKSAAPAGAEDTASRDAGPPEGEAGSDATTGGDTELTPNLQTRITKYLEMVPPAISGRRGHDQAYYTAKVLVWGFALSFENARPFMDAYSKRCSPPWSEDEISHKLRDARAATNHRRLRGYLLAPMESPPPEKRPCFKLHKDFWSNGTETHPPGVYHHDFEQKKDSDLRLIDSWLCTPLEVLATTATREDSEHGYLLEFTSRTGRKKRLAIPARCFAGETAEVLGELLAAGLEVFRPKQKLIVEYIAAEKPEQRYAAALSTGWHNDRTFVLPDEVIGTTKVWYQGKDEEIPYARAGRFEDWQTQVAARAVGNPNVAVALCGAFAGPLFHSFNVPGGGLHYFGPTTMGKTTLLEVGQSAYGGPKFRRTWETTAVGLQAVAMLHSDTLLVLDEIGQVDPRVLESAIYALVNGYGKSRGNVHAASRPVARWRVLVLSSGEVSSETQLSGSGLIVRAGQTIRMLDIPTEGQFGAFDNLHGFEGGAEFSDALRSSAGQHYGHAGPRFVRALIDARRDGKVDLAARLVETQKSFQPSNEPQRRAARIFATLAVAGELAVEWKILPWQPGEALAACVLLFQRWQTQTVTSAASSPAKKILATVANFISRFGDSRFSNLRPDPLDISYSHVHDRAGYWSDEALTEADGVTLKEPIETRRMYLFSPDGLREATKNSDFAQVLVALNAAGAFFRKGTEKIAKLQRTPRGVEPLYFVDPAKLA